MKKKALSLLLACTMAFSSFSMALAAGDAVVVEATQSNEQMAGDFLKAAGVLKGTDNGDLELTKVPTREEAMLMIARLKGKEDEALNFKGQSTFKDAKDNAYWAPVIAWAEAEGITKGMGDGTFGLKREVTQNEFVTMYLRVLGYEPIWEGKTLSADTQKIVEEKGLLTAVGDTFNRGAMAVMTVNTLKSTPKGAETTLAKNLNVDMTKAPKFVTPSVPGEIGDAKVESVKAIANDKIEVKFDKEVSAAAADFKVTEKADAAKAIEVKEAKMESAKVAVLTVEALTSGKAYTVKVGENTVNFTGIAKVTVAPVVKRVEGTDFNRVEIEFEKAVDKETAETVANYVIEKATVVKATLGSDRKTVTLETEGLVKNTLYKMTIENVKSVDAVAMKKVSKSFRAKEDTVAPKVNVVNIRNNQIVEITFSKEMNKESLANLENYKITSASGALEVLSAEVSKNIKENDTVTLKTAIQDVKTTYTLTVEGAKDATVKANTVTKFTRTFRGFAADTVAPTVNKVESLNNTLVKVTVAENNLLDKASVEDVSNYVFDKDLDVVSVELVADKNKYKESAKEILITTGAQKLGTSYKLTVKGIMDEFGNALKPLSGTNYRQYGFVGQDVDNSAPVVKEVKSLGLGKFQVTFDEAVNKATAQDPTNYVLSGDLGAATKATLKADTEEKVVEIETATQTAGTKYTVTINGVQDKYAGNAMANVKAIFYAKAEEADTTAPVLAYAYAPNSQELQVAFDKKVVKAGQTITLAGGLTATVVDIINDDTVLVFKLDANKEFESRSYTISAMSAVQDKSGNVFKFADLTESQRTFAGTTTKNAAPSVSSADIEQTAANKIKITFDENVTASAIKAKVGTDSTYTTFTKVKNGDTRNVLVVTTDKVYAAGTKLNFEFKTTVKDMLEKASEVENLDFFTYIAKPEKPVMVNVVATNNKTVELTFTEQINAEAPGQYTIYALDIDGKTKKEVQSATGVLNEDDATIVELNLEKAIKGSEVYYITYAVAPKNIEGTSADKMDPMSFQGSDVKPNVAYLSGVVFAGSQKVTLKDSAANAVAIKSIVMVGENTTTPVAIQTNDASTKQVTIFGHFNSDVKYRITTNETSERTFEFTGIRAVDESAAAVVAADKAALTVATEVDANTNTINLLTQGASGSAITWESSNTNVIGVNGAVTHSALTSVALTATITSGTAMDVKTFNVTVAAVAPGAAVTGLNALLQVNETTGPITAATTEAGAANWTSSNTSVATIDASTGVVTLVAAGTTTISYGSSTSGKVNSQEITVHAAAAVANPTFATVTAGGANVSPDGGSFTAPQAGQTIAWVSSDTAKATVNATTGAVTGVQAGPTVISYKVTETATGLIVAKGSVTVTVQ